MIIKLVHSKHQRGHEKDDVEELARNMDFFKENTNTQTHKQTNKNFFIKS
jgi:hypothetical protein